MTAAEWSDPRNSTVSEPAAAEAGWFHDVRFVAPTLDALDAQPAQWVVAALFQDELPVRGVGGLVDWRVSGRLSRGVETGVISAPPGHALVLPGRDLFFAGGVLLCDAGRRGQPDPACLRRYVRSGVEAVRQLGAERVIFELPWEARVRRGPASGVGTGEPQLSAALALLFEISRELGVRSAWALVAEASRHADLRLQLRSERWRVEAPAEGC